MTGDRLPNADHLARYCSPRQVENGVPRWLAFRPRPGDEYLSVNCLEFLEAGDLSAAVGEMRVVFGGTLRLRASGRFVVLNVAEVGAAVRDATGRSVHAEHRPTEQNPSHSGIVGYSAEDTTVAQAIAEIVMSEDVYPAVV